MITKFKIYENYTNLERDDIFIKFDEDDLKYKSRYKKFLDEIFSGVISREWLILQMIINVLKNNEIDYDLNYMIKNIDNELGLYRDIANRIGIKVAIDPYATEEQLLNFYKKTLEEEIPKIYEINPVIKNSEKFGI